MKPLFGGFSRSTAPLAHVNGKCFFAMHRTLAHADGGWFFVMHRTLTHANGGWFFCDALRRWRIPKGNGFINGGCRWLAGGFYAELFLWGLF